MNSKVLVAVLFVCAAFASANPVANKPLSSWNHKFLRPYLPPRDINQAIPVESLVPKKSYKKGTKTVANCGVPTFSDSPLPHKDGKIVGGTEVVPHSYPWQAELIINVIWFCGGSLINEEYIMTAGHCLYEETEATVTLGAHNINDDEPSQLTIRSNDLITHEDYQPSVIHNDIALVHLPVKVTYTDYIMPVCLPAYSDDTLPVGTIVTPTGWGLTSDTSTTVSPTLNSVDVPIYDHDLCKDYYGIVNDGIICIDSTGDHGTCEGDSGGPMNYVVNGVTVTRGIVSFGSSAGCDSGAPDAFTNVEYFLDWISANTGIAIDP